MRLCVDCRRDTGHTEVVRAWLGRKHRWCNRCNRLTESNWVHFAEGGAAFCASAGPSTAELDGVSCTDCLWQLIRERVALPVPDWRPCEAIAEDHYAA